MFRGRIYDSNDIGSICKLFNVIFVSGSKAPMLSREKERYAPKADSISKFAHCPISDIGS